MGRGREVNEGTADSRKRRAMIHLCVSPSTTEVNHGPSLFYPLLARWQRCLPGLLDSPAAFRSWLDRSFRDLPELFPKNFAQGYTLKDSRFSVKRGLRLRRIRCKATGQTFSVRPCFVLPYMTGWANEVEGPLFLRGFGVPFWALARVFGRGL